MYKLLNNEVIDLDTISWIGDIGGFGGSAACYWTGYSYKTYFCEKKSSVTISCEHTKEAFDKLRKQVDEEAEYIKNYMINKFKQYHSTNAT